jgi:Xaa-Pro dipeptidase
MGDRLANLSSALRETGFDAVAILPGASMRYLLSLDAHLTMRVIMAIFPADGDPVFVIPALEQPRAEVTIPIPIRFYPWTDSEGPQAALRQCAADLGLARMRLGVEYTSMRVLELRALEAAAPGVVVDDATSIIASLRMIKDADEIEAMRAAVRIIEDTLRTTIAQVRPGMTERQIAALWEQAIRVAGSAPSFDASVASGPNAANPHHTNTNRALQSGDLVIMDGGALLDGYASDITRTIAIGEPSPEARRIYELTLAANAAGRAAVRPGATGDAIDRAARTVITDGGYGSQFLHRTGHGLGLQIHEPPYIVSGNTDPLPVGATFTIEPGIYVAGFGGVRIEDDMVVTPDGGESLTTFDRELIVVRA